MTAFKKLSNTGFTLVELLIVIALLGIIALIVIAAINPLEQARRARDTKYSSDSSQLVSAIERYFVATSEFPWVTSGFVPTNDVAFGFLNANNANVGICAVGGCPAGGLLVDSLELKEEFANRDFLAATDPDVIYVGKQAGDSASVYACYIPQSKSVRDKACTDDQVYNLNTTTGARVSVTCAAGDPWDSSGGATGAWHVCVPQ